MSKTEERKSRLNNNPSGGKIPPQDALIEDQILGTLIQSPNSIISVLDLLKPQLFYMKGSQHICESILTLYNSARSIDVSTVCNELRVKGVLEVVGGMFHVLELTNKATYDGLRDKVKIISQKYISRETIAISQEAAHKAYEDTLNDPFELVNSTITKLSNLQQGTMETTEQLVSEFALNAMKERDRLKGKRVKVRGYSTGWESADRKTSGLKRKELTIIAARPAMGKTALAVNLAKNVAVVNKVPTGIVSLEMTGGQLYARFQSSQSGIDANKILENDLTENENIILLGADTELGKAPLFIDEPSAMHVDELCAKAIMWCYKYGLKVLIVDYLGLLQGTGFTKELEIGYISRRLKALAKNQDIAVVALCQLSRAVESRGNKMPQLSDLRDSGSIEQDADNVWFLYRPAYYDAKESVYFTDLNTELSPQNLLVIIIAKQREGETGFIPLQIILKKMQVNEHPALEERYKAEMIALSQKVMPIDTSSQGDIPF